MQPLLSARVRAPRAALAALALLAGACTDHPLAPKPGPNGPGMPGAPGGAPVTLQALECTASRKTMAVACAAPAAGGGAASGIVYGGQNLYVTLASSNVAYNGMTGRFTADVTVKNLIPQPIGTVDGVNPDPGGVRVFFTSGPTVTGGSGVAAVIPDGFDAFTAAGQPFYAYPGVLADDQTSAAKEWTFIISPTVETFAFVVYVSSPVEYPDGYVELDGQLPGSAGPTLHPGEAHPLAAVVRTAVGAPVPGATVAFATADPLCATVSPTGVVTGVRAATCAITATSTIGVTPVAGGLDFGVLGTIRLWEGDVSSDWADGANWQGGLTPAAVDSAQIPVVAGPNVYPVLTADVPIGGVYVDDGANLSVAGFLLTVSADVQTGTTPGGGIVGTTGRVVLDGPGGTVRGRLPDVEVTGTYALSGDLYVGSPLEVLLEMLTNDGFLLDGLD